MLRLISSEVDPDVEANMPPIENGLIAIAGYDSEKELDLIILLYILILLYY